MEWYSDRLPRGTPVGSFDFEILPARRHPHPAGDAVRKADALECWITVGQREFRDETAVGLIARAQRCTE
jgi:hypothetical protein